MAQHIRDTILVFPSRNPILIFYYCVSDMEKRSGAVLELGTWPNQETEVLNNTA